MTSTQRWSVALALVACATACESDGPTDQGGGSAPPRPSLPEPRVTVAPLIATPNDIAFQARGLVRGQLQRVVLELGPIATRLKSFEQQRYTEDGHGRWIGEVTGSTPECSSIYSVERSGSGLLWRWTWDGLCDGAELDDYELSSMTTAPDGNSGRLDEHWGQGPVGGMIERFTRLDWNVAPPVASWRRLTRRTDPPTLEVTFEQHPGDDDGVEYEMKGEASFHWLLQCATDGTRGSFKLDRWDTNGSRWIQSELVTWEGEHGTWRSDPELGESRERSW